MSELKENGEGERKDDETEPETDESKREGQEI
jgi:hypothetical protein